MPPPERFPIILAHGITRFDIVQHTLVSQFKSLGVFFEDDNLEYFKGVKTLLVANGFEVFATSVGFAAGVDQRAKELATQIKQFLTATNHTKVHIIGHSMGGLDARHMIVDIPGMADKVSSLTTIGTPHHGTIFANRCLESGGKILIEALRGVLSFEGFKDLTLEACDAFNQRAQAAEAANGVKYQTYSSKEEMRAVFFPLQASWAIINKADGDNDGLVSVKSQAWVPMLTDGQMKKPVFRKEFPTPADHLNEVGWWDPNEFSGNPLDLLSLKAHIAKFEFKIRGVYLDIAQKLQAQS